MKKYLKVFGIFFVGLFLVINIVNNNTTIKNVEKDTKLKESKNDTTWQNDFEYILDVENKTLIIDRYIGDDKSVVIPGKSIIDGIEYTTEMVNYRKRAYDIEVLFPNVEELTIGDGVIMPAEMNKMFGGNFGRKKFKKFTIGNVILPENVGMGHLTIVSEEVDISKLDMTNVETSYKMLDGDFTKITVGEKTKFMGSYPYNSEYTGLELPKPKGNGYWQKEGTDLIYLPIELMRYYDGKTMKGTYAHSYGNFIVYNSNGGKGYVTSQLINDSGKTTLRKNEFERYGYKFVGWNTAADGTGTSYNASTPVDIKDNTTLYAIWEKDGQAKELEYTKLKILVDIDEEDMNYMPTYTNFNFDLKLEIDGVEYAEPIKYANYGISASANEEVTYGEVPVGAKYTLKHKVGNGETAKLSSGDSLTGTIEKDGTIVIKMVPNTIDLTITRKVMGVNYDTAFPVFVNLSNYDIGKSFEVKYTGSQNGTLEIGQSANKFMFMLKNNETIVIHDLPVKMHWEIPIGFENSYSFPDYKCYVGEMSCSELYSADTTPDTSGNFGQYGHMYNLTVTSILYPSNYHRFLNIYKYNKSSGIETRDFSFLITAYKDSSKTETISGVYPYKIIEHDSTEIIKKGQLTLDEKGEVIVKLKPGQRLVLGNDDFYSNDYDDVTIKEYGVFPYGTFFNVKELDEENYEPLEFTIDTTTRGFDYYLMYNVRKRNGILNVTKEIDETVPIDKEFKFKFKADDNVYFDEIKHKKTGAEQYTTTLLSNNEFIFTLKGGETIEFVTYKDMKYEIEELDNEDYVVVSENSKGIIGEETNVKFINKIGEFEGNLTLTKIIKGSVDKNKEFEFKINLLNVGLGSKISEYAYKGDKEGTIVFENNEAIIKLKGGESITIESLPIDVEYEITEVDSDDYIVSSTNEKGKISKDTKVEFTNYKEEVVEPDTNDKEETIVPDTSDNILVYMFISIISIITIILVTNKLRKVNV